MRAGDRFGGENGPYVRMIVNQCKTTISSPNVFKWVSDSTYCSKLSGRWRQNNGISANRQLPLLTISL